VSAVNQDRFESLLRDAGLSALVAGSPHAFAYFTGERLETQVAIPDRLAFATRARGGGLWVTVCAIEAGQLAHAGAEVVPYEEFAERPVDVLAAQLLGAGLSGRVGYEAAWMPGEVFAALERALAGHIELVPADALFGRLWAVKSAAEIAHLERGARATIGAIGASFTPGHRTEIDVAVDLASGILRGGGEAVAFMILAAGERSLVGHPVPTAEPLRDGDMIRTDVGGRFGGYLSDLARTGVIGRPDPAVADAYGRLADIHDQILGAVRPGAAARDLLLRSEVLFEAAGLPFSRHLVGHNIGILVHEWPILNAFEQAPLETGMVLCIEHGAQGPRGRLHIENTGVVTADGFRLFTEACPWDRPLQL
jgi:Xaa-Pro aminopeptidase